MGFTSAVVTDKKNALVIDNLVQPQLREHVVLDFLCHVIRHDIAFNQPGSLGFVIRVCKLNDAFNRVKAD